MKLKAPPGLEDLAVESEPELVPVSQGESSTATSDTTPHSTEFTPSNNSTPVSAPTTPPTPTVTQELLPTSTSNPELTNNLPDATEAPPPYDPKLVQQV